MDITNFTEFSPTKAKSTRGSRTQIFFTLSDKNIIFSSGATSALSVKCVKIMLNNADGQILLLESEEGANFVKNAEKPKVIWAKADVLQKVSSMVPAEKKTGKSVRINGEIVEVDGKKGILFTCK